MALATVTILAAAIFTLVGIGATAFLIWTRRHKSETIETQSAHITPPGGNVFADMGFKPTEAEALHAESMRIIMDKLGVSEVDEPIYLTRRESERLLELMENPPPFNEKLRKLMVDYERMEIESEAEEVFGSAELAKAWLTQENAELGTTPLVMLESEGGAKEVRKVLSSISHGGAV